MRIRWVVMGLVLVALGVGCDEEVVIPTPEPDLYSWSWVMDGVTNEFIEGLRVVLYDIDQGRPVGAPTISNSSGHVETDVDSNGHYRWMILPGQGWIPLEFPEPATVENRNFNGISYFPVPVIYALPTSNAGPPILAGTVLDDLTGEPLAGVVVGYPGWPTAWDGLDETSSDVTGDDGAFLASDVFFAIDPGGDGEPVQVLPLAFQAEGYRPRSLRFDAPGVGYEVRLTPLASGLESRGALSGRVIGRNGPVAGLGVVGTWIGDGDKSWLTHPGVVAETDADGRFHLDDLAPGEWFVKPGYLPMDGWTLITGIAGHGGTLPASVAVGDTVDVGELRVLPGISPRYPYPGATHVDSLPTFRWAAVAEADSYDVFLGRWWLGRTAADTMAVPEDFPLEEGSWSWYMNAITADGELVAITETRYRFVVGPFTP